jgi:hypothetical protein
MKKVLTGKNKTSRRQNHNSVNRAEEGVEGVVAVVEAEAVVVAIIAEEANLGVAVVGNKRRTIQEVLQHRKRFVGY